MRILLVEDDIKIAGFIIKGMSEAGFIIDHAKDGNTGYSLAKNGDYDCIIQDIMLPGLDGLSIIEKLRSKKNNLPVIILSARHSLDDRIKGLRLGADDYLTKPFAFSELLARIHALLRRSSNVPEATSLSIDDLTIDVLSHTVIRGGKKIVLQPKEFSLLEYMMRNAGRIVSKTMIMERVWDYNFDPHTNVVEARVCRLREKIDKGFNTSLIHTVRGLGYIVKSENE